jgi:thiol-disulfide isomerase/thioredoxin
MTALDLNTAPKAEIQQLLTKHQTIVACLCAAWCDVCTSYRVKFEEFAAHHPEFLFLWIDIEDQAELVGDIEVENFPTLLIQQHNVVTFFGTMQPDTKQLKRLLQSQAHLSVEQLLKQSTANQQHRLWQSEANLVQRLVQHV